MAQGHATRLLGDRRRVFDSQRDWKMSHDVEVADPLLHTVVEEIERLHTEIAQVHGRRLVTGMAGAVSVGKTTFAGMVSAELGKRHGAVTRVVGTDGFLLPNLVLEPRGRMFHKGYPDTYDTGALQLFLATAASPVVEVTIPVYSHEVFDTVGTQVIVLPDIVIVEGINILGDAYVPLLDLRIYLDADEQVVVDWFVARFLRLIAEAESDPASFYVRFVSLGAKERAETARGVWDAINGPNLHEHIAPTRANADLVLKFHADHSMASVEVCDPR